MHFVGPKICVGQLDRHNGCARQLEVLTVYKTPSVMPCACLLG